MEDEPVKINDEYKLKQIDDKFSPLKSGSDVAYKKFKYSYNHSDKERIETSKQELMLMLDQI